MERRNGEGVRYALGKIAALAKFAEAHREALTYDLITRTNYQIEDVGGALGWGAFESFIHNLGPDSALARDMGFSTGWESQTKTNAILADIYDLLQVINRNLIAANSKKPPHGNIKPYPRPGAENKEKKIGSGALPKDDLHKWIEKKRKQYKGTK